MSNPIKIEEREAENIFEEEFFYETSILEEDMVVDK